jgi:predicted ferric reductase
VAPVGHEGFRFRPGQFAWVTVGGSPFSLSEHPFSISSSAEQGDSLTFTIKELGDFTRGVGRVAEGSKVYVDGPYGAFTVDNFPDARGFVFLAGGVGIAPVMGMLRTLADRGDQRPHVLLYGSWTWEHVIFREQLEELESRMNLRVVHVLQEAPSGWTGETGFLTESLLERQIGSETDGRVFFVCGPKPMIALVERGLHAIGVPVRAIQTELFDLV